MKTKILTKLLSLLFILSLTACSADEKNDPESVTAEHDYLLVGKWTGSTTSNKNIADELQLFADGTGKYSKNDRTGTLKWKTLDATLNITLDNGSGGEWEYFVTGTTLTTSDEQYYIMDSPLLGGWYMNSFTNPVFSYYFYSDGQAILEKFNDDGLLTEHRMLWKRLENNGIEIRTLQEKRELVYQVTDNVLSLSGEGNFVRKNPWGLEGNWTSKYTETGEILTGEHRYSHIKMDAEDTFGRNPHFYCDYYNEAGYKQTLECNWKGWSSVYLALYSAEEYWQEYMLYYRYRMNKADRKIYLEISREEDYKQYVGYYK